MLAQRWHIAPSAVLAEPAPLVFGVLESLAEPLPELPTDDEQRLMALGPLMERAGGR